MADPGVSIRLNPAYPEWAADVQKFRNTTILIGSTWEKRTFYPWRPNPPGGPNNAGGGNTVGIVINHQPYVIPRASWLDARPEFLAEIALLIEKGKVLVQDLATGVTLTEEQVHHRDLPEPVEIEADLVAVTGDPTLVTDGVDVRGYRCTLIATPTVVPADATFQPWIYVQTGEGTGLWTAVGDPVQVNSDNPEIIELSSEAQAIASRVYLQLVTYVNGTWTTTVLRRVDRET